MKKEHSVGFVVTLYFPSLFCNALRCGKVSQSTFKEFEKEEIIIQFVRLVKSVTKMLLYLHYRTNKVLSTIWKYWTLSKYPQNLLFLFQLKVLKDLNWNLSDWPELTWELTSALLLTGDYPLRAKRAGIFKMLSRKNQPTW